MKEKPDTVAIHIGSNNITHRIFEDFNADKLADEITDIGKMRRQYGVKDLLFLFFLLFLWKNNIKVGKMISQVNGTVKKMWNRWIPFCLKWQYFAEAFV